nr:hypothetical protein [Mycoplasmopsis bovis]
MALLRIMSNIVHFQSNILLKHDSRHRSSDRVSQSDKLFTAKAKTSTGIELGLLIIKSLYGEDLYWNSESWINWRINKNQAKKSCLVLLSLLNDNYACAERIPLRFNVLIVFALTL